MSRTKLRSILYGTTIVLAGGLLFAGFGITIAPDANTRLSGARMVAGLGDYDSALAMCDKVLTEHPDNLDARVYRATFLGQAERFDEALAAYDDVCGRVDDPQFLRSLRADRASVLLHAGREREFRDARDALARDRMDRFVHMLDGIAARTHRKWTDAEAAFRRAIADDPDNSHGRSLLVDVIISRARDELAAGRYEASLTAYEAVLAEDSARTDVALEAVEVHLAAKQEVAAVAALKAIGLDKRGVAPLLFRAATAMLDRGDRKQALETVALAAKANATVAEALYTKDPAWAEVRKTTPFATIVSNRDANSDAGLPGADAVIGSRR